MGTSVGELICQRPQTRAQPWPRQQRFMRKYRAARRHYVSASRLRRSLTCQVPGPSCQVLSCSAVSVSIAMTMLERQLRDSCRRSGTK